MIGRRVVQSRALRQPNLNSFFSYTHHAPLRPTSASPKVKPSHMSFGRWRSTWSEAQDWATARNYRQKNTILWGLIGINTVVFAGWLYSGENMRSGRRASSQLGKFMKENFLLSSLHLKAKKYWTLITCHFSHIEPMHFLGNMITIYAFGSVLRYNPVVTPARLLVLIFGSALTSSAADLYNRAQNGKTGFSLGASGVAMGLGAAAACLNPHVTFLIFGIVPAPLWALVPGYFLLDLYYLPDGSSRIGHAAHLGGGAFGLAYFLLVLRSGKMGMMRTFRR